MAPHRSSGRLWPSGSRVARLRANRTYGVVLLLVMAMFVFIMAAPELGWTRSVLALLLCGTLIVAAWTSGFGWSLARTLGLITVGVTIAVFAEIVSGDQAAGAVWLVGFVLAAAIIGFIVLGVVDQGEVNRQSMLHHDGHRRLRRLHRRRRPREDAGRSRGAARPAVLGHGRRAPRRPPQVEAARGLRLVPSLRPSALTAGFSSNVWEGRTRQTRWAGFPRSGNWPARTLHSRRRRRFGSIDCGTPQPRRP